MVESVDGFEDHLAFLGRHLLGVPAVGHRLVLVVLQPDVAQLDVGHVLDVDPPDLELTFELVLHPHAGAAVGVVHRRQHLRHSAEMSGSVDAEQEEDGSLSVSLAERRVQPLVAVFGRAPDFVLDAPMNVVLAETLDDEKASVFRVQVERFGVVVVRVLQAFQDRVSNQRTSAAAILIGIDVVSTHGTTAAITSTSAIGSCGRTGCPWGAVLLLNVRSVLTPTSAATPGGRPVVRRWSVMSRHHGPVRRH